VSFPAVLYRGEARVGAGGGERWAASLALPFDAAARLRAGHVVVEGAGAVAADRTVRERAVEDAARSLHGPLRRGVPLAVRPGSAAGDLLGIEETGWLLDALPRLAFVLDPARARRLHLAEHGPAPEVWAERFGPRTNLIACHGFGDSDAGGRHPAEDDLAWRVLSEMVPRRTPWLLDLAPDLGVGDLSDALGYLADRLGH
jgi:hypothetical protein